MEMTRSLLSGCDHVIAEEKEESLSLELSRERYLPELTQTEMIRSSVKESFLGEWQDRTKIFKF
jgi:hypothetical protein